MNTNLNTINAIPSWFTRWSLKSKHLNIKKCYTVYTYIPNYIKFCNLQVMGITVNVQNMWCRSGKIGICVHFYPLLEVKHG